MNISCNWKYHNNSIPGQSGVSVSLAKWIPEGFWQLVRFAGTLDTLSMGHITVPVVSGGSHVFTCFFICVLIKSLGYMKQALSVLQQCGWGFCDMVLNDLTLTPEVEVMFSLIVWVYFKSFSFVHMNLISTLCEIIQSFKYISVLQISEDQFIKVCLLRVDKEAILFILFPLYFMYFWAHCRLVVCPRKHLLTSCRYQERD